MKFTKGDTSLLAKVGRWQIIFDVEHVLCPKNSWSMFNAHTNEMFFRDVSVKEIFMKKKLFCSTFAWHLIVSKSHKLTNILEFDFLIQTQHHCLMLLEVNDVGDLWYLLLYAFDKRRWLLTDDRVIHFNENDAGALELRVRLKRSFGGEIFGNYFLLFSNFVLKFRLN